MRAEVRHEDSRAVATQAGKAGGASPLHYDMRANLFCQLHGRKRVCLAKPAAWRALKPHPLTSPYDRRAKVRTSNLPATGVGAAAVVLDPGDVLFIPPFHWHDVQQLDTPTISLAFWFVTGFGLVQGGKRVSVSHHSLERLL